MLMVEFFFIPSIAQGDVLSQLHAFLDRISDRPWAAFVELLLIGSVVYSVLRMLQGTPGARLVRAVLTILGVSFAVVWLVAERFGLDRINALYPYFILAVFLASLVAFQSELRRILSKVAEGVWLQRLLKTPPESIEPLLEAAGRLSQRKIGALVAIERHTELTTWIDLGVKIDAQLTSELLETMFWPGSPLHDLGMIVSDGRISAAGCQFPLAESGQVDRSLGSRHRAAVGMSEETDAVILVVSEETGAISIAMNGQLRRGIALEELRELLLLALSVEGGASSRSTSAVQPRDSILMDSA